MKNTGMNNSRRHRSHQHKELLVLRKEVGLFGWIGEVVSRKEIRIRTT
jgi:hypothetical protein